MTDLLRFAFMAIVLGGAASGCVAAPCSSGLPKKVTDNCGCDPRAQAIEGALRQTDFTDIIKTKVKMCANASVEAETAGQSLFKAKFDGCISKELSTDEKLRDQVIKIVDEAMARENVEVKSAWTACYKANVGGN